jgi:hypothetical protein
MKNNFIVSLFEVLTCSNFNNSKCFTLPENSSAPSTSLSAPAAVVRYITTYSQGNAVKQAVLFPVVKVATSENGASATSDRSVTKTTPVVSVLNNGTNFIANGRSLQQQTYVGATNLLQQVSVEDKFLNSILTVSSSDVTRNSDVK